MARPKQIIAMGGGGFQMEPDNPLLDRYVLTSTPARRPKICFVPTASGDREGLIRAFYESFGRLECEPSHLSLFLIPDRDLEAFVLDKDAVYVGGGNTFNMLALWRAWGLDRVLRRAWERGVVLAGLSAGSVCWFEGCVTDSFTPEESTALETMDCLAFLRGSNCPHYDSQASRRPEYHRFVEDGRLGDGWAADDGAALHFVGDELAAIVASRPAAAAYRVEKRGDQVVERRLDVRYLGKES